MAFDGLNGCVNQSLGLHGEQAFLARPESRLLFSLPSVHFECFGEVVFYLVVVVGYEDVVKLFLKENVLFSKFIKLYLLLGNFLRLVLVVQL